MKVLLSILILGFIESSFAASGDVVCANCVYSNGLGYIGDDGNCNHFYQCVKLPNGKVEASLFCCPNLTRWDQSHLGCVTGKCFDSRARCPGVPTTTDFPCPFKPSPDDKKLYIDKLTHVVGQCADGTIYSDEDCTCVVGGESTCSDDPLMYFPFAYHFNDIQCHKVKGTEHGDTKLLLDQGCIALDGEGDYVSFGFLQNYFAWRRLKHFTVSIWFNQTEDGWYNRNSSPVEGLFGNGNCDEEASIWLTMGNTTQQGGIRTDEATAIFDKTGIDVDDRFYIEPLVWCQVAIRYTETEVTLFLNGDVTGKRSISGYIKNTFAASTIGLTYFGCDPFFWTGYLDDVMIFDRYVSDAEMADNVFGRARAGPSNEYPYESDFFP